MIHQNLLLLLTLFFAMALLYLLSQRLKISYPIFLVIGGLGISLLPGMPVISIDPDLVSLYSQDFEFGQFNLDELEIKTYAADTSANAVVLREFGTARISSGDRTP